MKSKSYLPVIALMVFSAIPNLNAQFLPEQILAGTNTTFTGARIADINADGQPDLVCILSDQYQIIAWYLNDGQGHFPVNPTDSLEIGFQINDVAVADLNGDGFQDFAVVDENGTGHLRWYAGDGQGHFVQNPVDYSEIDALLGCQAGDMDADGDVDLVLEHGQFSAVNVKWVENDGHGNFSNPRQTGYFTGWYADVIVEDMNNDGAPEVLVPNKTTWFQNYGAGYFEVRPFPSDAPYLFGISDADGDGDKDIFTFGANFKIVLLKNNWAQANPSFTSVELPINFDPNNQLALAGDYDGDGDPDLIGADSRWYENDGTGVFTLRPEVPVYPGMNNWPNLTSNTWDAVDIDGDGHLESLLFGFGWVRKIGLNAEQTVRSELLVPDLRGVSVVKPRDFDGDGDQDLVVASDRLYWLPNEGGGHFGVRRTITDLPFFVVNFQFSDLDGDGDQDIVMQPYAAPQNLHLNYFLRNLGFGAYAKVTTLPFNGPSPLLLHDFDNDGDTDIIGGYFFQFARNIGNGNFADPQLLTTCYAGEPAVYDMDNDGDLDIAVPCDNGVTILQNDGAANFTVFQEIALNVRALKCWWTDLDGNGMMDIAVAMNGSIAWLPRRNDGYWDSMRQIYSWPDAENAFTKGIFADFDGDGDVDLELPVPNVATLLENDGTGTFSSVFQPYYLHALGYGAEVFDKDGDHDLDLVFGNDQIVGWLENISGQAYFSGVCYMDYNENKQRDSGEPPAQNQIVRLSPAGQAIFTDAEGRFRFYPDTGHAVLSLTPDSCWTFSTDSAAYHLYFDGINIQKNLDFGLKSAGTEKKLAAHIVSAPTRCGFEIPAYVSLHNEGCAISASVFELYFDSLATFISAEPPPSAVSGNQVVWNYGDTLQPGDTRYIKLLVKIAGTEHLGDTIHWIGITRALDQAGNPEDRADSSFFISRINCSYDPNDKLVNRAQLPELYEVANSELVYTIRFQNTGTDTAFNVTVRDRLAPELELSTFRPFGADHPYTVTIDSATRTAVFSFKNILLPDSNTNEIASHGMLQFGIRPLAHLPGGTTIENRAGIYFDFNPPIATNTAETRIQQPPVATWQPLSDKNSIQVWPNPASGEVFVAWKLPIPAGGGRLTLSDLAGRPLYAGDLSPFTTNFRLDIHNLAPGLYFLQLVAGNPSEHAVKLVKSN